MRKLVVKENLLLFGNDTFEFNDLFTNEFYKYSDDHVYDYKFDIPIVNEVFLRYSQPAMALELFIKKNRIELIEIREIDEMLYPIIIDMGKANNIKVIGKRKTIGYKKMLMGHFYLIASTLYLLWKMILIPHASKVYQDKKNFSVIRTPAAKKKMDSILGIDIEIEDYQSSQTIYNYFNRRLRISWVIKSWIMSYKELKSYTNIVNEKIGNETAKDTFKYYGKRIVHSLLYQYMLDYYFSMNVGKTFFTGNNLDRFAISEEKIAEKHKVNTVCIPHGLEYGFKLPYGFTCNIFYTTSKKAEEHLNHLYSTNKFRYDEEITHKMFRQQPVIGMNGENIVFFTEPREVDVNIEIMRELLPLLEREHLQLYVKLHPKDKKSNYKEFINRIIFIEDIKDALVGNKCFARKSTTLLEALHNGSEVSAILINEKDAAIFNTFPSLQDGKIQVFNSTLELFDWLSGQSIE